MKKNIVRSVTIRPKVTVLSVLAHLEYKPWFALAEYVDNSIQSFVKNKPRLKKLHNNYKLKIDIYISNSVIEIKDNAAGIDQKNYERAFQAAMRPKKTDGLSEFGMGMKTAALWFSKGFEVQSTALGEKVERTVKFDLNRALDEGTAKYKPKVESAGVNHHGTTVILNQLRIRLKSVI